MEVHVVGNKVAKPFQYRGGWRVAVTLPDGKRLTCVFDKYADAVQWAADPKANARFERAPALDGPKRATLAEALDYYARVYSVNKKGVVGELARINRYLAAAGMPLLEALKTEHDDMKVQVRASHNSVPPSSQKQLSERRTMRSETNTRRDALAVMPCSCISPRILGEFQAAMVEDGLSESTAQKEFSLLKTMFNAAIRQWSWEYFDNPCANMKFRKSKRRLVKFEPAQRQALEVAIEECGIPFFAPLVFVARETMLRKKTLLDLRWSDVDFGDRNSLAETKSGQVQHKFSKPVVEVLLQMPKSPCGRIFPMSASSVTQAWNRVRVRANLPELQYRDLRHIGATDWARRGLTAPMLSKLLGQTSITTAQRCIDIVGLDVGKALDEAMQKYGPLQLPAPSLSHLEARRDHNPARRLQEAAAKRSVGHEERVAGGAPPDAGVPCQKSVPVYHK